MAHGEALDLAHIMLIVLVFALEIPVLVVEASADDRLRHLLHKRATHKVVTILMVLTLMLVIALILIAGTESAANKERGAAPAAGPKSGFVTREHDKLVVSAQPSATVSVNRSWLARGTDELVRIVADIGPFARYTSVALLVLFGFCWLFMMKTDVRSNLVKGIKASMRRSYKKRRMYRVEDLEDLLALGENGEPGHEKKVVIEALAAICHDVVSRPDYDGNDLEGIVHGVQRVLCGATHQGSVANFVSGIHILEDAWVQLTERNLTGRPDAAALVESICAIGETGLPVLPDAVLYKCVNTMRDHSQISFRIGLAALKACRYRVAMAALRHLEILADEGDGLPRELVGLAAHLHVHGKATRAASREVSGYLGESAESIQATAGECADAFYHTGDFETAEAIRAYLWSLTAKDWPTAQVSGRSKPTSVFLTIAAASLVALAATRRLR